MLNELLDISAKSPCISWDYFWSVTDSSAYCINFQQTSGHFNILIHIYD